jgi:F5/8 type C domain/Dolichyl-phosphate-mannose-protein mannosyltransferase
MRVVLSILFGTALTVSTAWALGAILIRKLSLIFFCAEERLYSFLIGSACLSAIMFALAAVRLVRKGVLLALAVLAIGYALHLRAHRSRGSALPALPQIWKWIFTVAFSGFTVFYFFNAMAPEYSPDGMAYHLGEVAKYYRAHGFVRVPTNIYNNLSQGIELLFLHSFIFGKHSAAALVHFAFLVCVTLLILSYGRRIGRPAVGAAGALLFYASPIVGQDGSVAYIDVAVAAIVFGLFYLLQIWDDSRDSKLLIPIGILAGFSVAAKYTAFLAIPYALGFIVWKLWRAHRPVLRPVFGTSLIALVFIAPWLVKNWMWVDNPVSPFANRLFPNRYVHASFEDGYREFLQLYNLKSRREIPRQITLKGDMLNGFFGPLFLLTPLALLALRYRPGRQLWLAALVFALPYYTNIGTRFLIPAAPFVCLALALTFANMPWLLMLLAVLHMVSAVPRVENKYTAVASWRLMRIPIKAALRIEPEEKYLSRSTPLFDEARLIEHAVPPGEPVFSFGQMAESYLSRDILVRYQGAFNETLGDIIWTPIFGQLQANRVLAFQIPRHDLRKVRVVQTANAQDLSWGIAELRILEGGRELPRTPEWRLKAHPNPWDVQMAFDNSPVTRWRSWQRAEPGMFVEVDFGHVQAVDAVKIETSDDASQTNVQLEGMDPDGKWTTLSKTAQETPSHAAGNLRRTATAELKLRGIRYVMVQRDDPRWDDFQAYSKVWGLKLIGQSGPGRLYFIE